MEKYPPTNIRLLCNVLEWTGLHCQPNTKNWRGFLLQLFCYAQHCFIGLFLFFRFLNTFTRSVHYLPEFYQMLMEDSGLLFCYFKIQLLYHRYSDIQSLTNLMENSFSNVDRKMTTACSRKSKIISMGFIFSALCLFITNFYDKMIVPLSERVLHNEKHINETKTFPCRKILLKIYIPYVDECEFWPNIVINIFEFYLIIVIVLAGFTLASLMPAVIIQIEGQYRILNRYMKQIGKIHTDCKGNPIWFTNIENCDYVFVENKCQPSTSKPSPLERIMLRKQRILNQILYEQSYVKQLVKFHQKLSKFQYKMANLFSWDMTATISLYSLSLCLGLYQLTLNKGESLSFIRQFKFVLEFFCIAAYYYYLCHCSNILDECQLKLARSLYKSDWYKCSRKTQKDLLVMLRQLQRSNYLKSIRGSLILNKVLFMKAAKFAYSFVNCIRVRR
uniref:Odorant receptor n=1 Tax=Cacopsylla melanoneura TaxID=428564 RepID=A0A8D9B7P5_9HEMI